MLEEILISGFGGQGIMVMGHIIAYGAINEGLEVTFFPSYGPEMRGGTANCTVVNSDQIVGSPIRNTYTALMAMNQASLEKFQVLLKPGGVLAYNKTLVQTPPKRNDVRVLGIPADGIASELGDVRVANMVAVGGLLAALNIISVDSVLEALRQELPKHRYHLIPLNEEAIKKGTEIAKESAGRDK
jgi:2-oxoglutarate ferredoxin oxidoreductase subunit gamma